MRDLAVSLLPKLGPGCAIVRFGISRMRILIRVERVWSLRGDPSRLAPLAPPAITAEPLRRDDVSLCGDTPYFFPFTAASKLVFAEPGFSGFC